MLRSSTVGLLPSILMGVAIETNIKYEGPFEYRTVNHLFRNLDKYQGLYSDRGFDPGGPVTKC